ncbi:SDR family NAD(P)-dependent oxidoreductase [Candidatus Enterococcus mansonii]|nr:SDR family oxidoreductase [Enterococcus sp. 4G2_DIV0659]
MMKKVIITGAAGGIGVAAVKKCLDEGYQVLATDKDISALEQLPKHEYLAIQVLDITNTKAVKAFFSRLEQDSSLYGLVNNAGIYFAKNILDYSDAEMEKIWQVNIKGPTICTRFFVECLLFQKSKGRIVNISSISGQEGSSDALYGLSKAALLGLTKSTAMNFAPNILVNAITPTMVETQMMAHIPDWRKKEYQNHQLLTSPVLPEDVANTIAFLLSKQSSHYTGATFDLNNGGYLR